MAEVMGVLREVQNTAGRGSRRSKVVKDDSAAVGATKADRKMAVARNKDVATASWSDFAVTKADAGKKEAAGSITGQIGVAKAGAGKKEVAGSFIGVTKAGAGNKEVAGSFIGVTKAGAGKEEVAGNFTSKIGVTKADDAAGSFTGDEIGVSKAVAGKELAGCITGDVDIIKAEVEVAGKGVVTELDWIQFVFPRPPVELLERKAEPTGGVTKEMVPKVIIERLKLKKPFKKLPPVEDDLSDLYDVFPHLRESYISHMSWWNYLVDLHIDVLEQDKEKGYAELGVDFTQGDKMMFILPK